MQLVVHVEIKLVSGSRGTVVIREDYFLKRYWAVTFI